MRVLYISYDGILEPLGQSQILSYLKALATNHEICLVTYEKPDDWSNQARRAGLQEAVRSHGIEWLPLRYHRNPPVVSTAWDILSGMWRCLLIVRRRNIEVVHARSYVPSVIARILKQLLGVKYIFDMRGFWPDERVDGGSMKRESPVFRTAKYLERKFLTEADVIVSLTAAAVEDMSRLSYMEEIQPVFEVIPTCTDLELFKPAPPPASREFVLGYVGSVGSYYLFDHVLTAFQLLRAHRAEARLLIVNRGQHELILGAIMGHGIDRSAVEIVAAEYQDVPQQIARMHAGVFFIMPVFSKRASSPTRLGEFLACGRPCLSNAGVGDVEEILQADRVGVAVPGFSETELRAGVVQLLELVEDPATAARCVAVARERLDLAHGVARYHAVYESLHPVPA